MKEVREGGMYPPPEEGIAREGVADTTRNKPRRSNSLNYHHADAPSKTSSSTNLAKTTATDHTHHTHPQQYPLRETVSLTQLPGGGYAASGRPHGRGSTTGHAHSTGAFVGNPLNQPSKSMSLRSLPSQQQQQQFDTDSAYHRERTRIKGSSSHHRKLEKVCVYLPLASVAIEMGVWAGASPGVHTKGCVIRCAISIHSR